MNKKIKLALLGVGLLLVAVVVYWSVSGTKFGGTQTPTVYDGKYIYTSTAINTPMSGQSDTAFYGDVTVNGRFNTIREAVNTAYSSNGNVCAIKNTWGNSFLTLASVDTTGTIPTSTYWSVGTSTTALVGANYQGIMTNATITTSTLTFINNKDNAGTSGKSVVPWLLNEYVVFHATTTPTSYFNSSSLYPAGYCYAEFRVK